LAGLGIVIATILIVQHVSLKPTQTHASIPLQEKPAPPLPDIPSIAVLPFTNLSGDPRQEYFSDGIAVQLIDSLSRLPGLFVIARNSSFAYKGKPTKESEIGKELGVRYVLEGNVSKETDQVRIGVELVDASSGTDEWTAQSKANTLAQRFSQEYAKVILRDVNMEDGSTLERTQTMLASRAKKEIVLQDQELLIRHHHHVAESYLKDPVPTPLD
jgi:adenylate cyclase